MPNVPKLVNRGPAGLLSKLDKPKENGEAVKASSFVEDLLGRFPDAGKAKIAPALKALVVDLSTLTPDPDNARMHPDRNLEAIMESLAAYGQVKPLVVRKKGLVVMAGNGTLEAAKLLGWTKIAAAVHDMTEAQAAGYGLADNRTAELAKWDFETVARLDRLVADVGGPMIGWTMDELSALRVGSFVEPPNDFPEVDESIEVEHVCPKCGYQFSGGETVEAS